MVFIECFQSTCGNIQAAFVVYIIPAWKHVRSIVTCLNCSAGERDLNLKDISWVDTFGTWTGFHDHFYDEHSCMHSSMHAVHECAHDDSFWHAVENDGVIIMRVSTIHRLAGNTSGPSELMYSYYKLLLGCVLCNYDRLTLSVGLHG